MLKNLKHFFDTNFSPASSETSDEAIEHAIQLALAALMIEVAESDYRDVPEEREVLLNIVKNSFDLSPDEAQNIIDLAKKEHADSTDYFQFTRLINDNYSASQKIKMIENLWRVAFADKQLDKYEEHVIRRIADLIHVSHSDFMATKLRIQNEH